MYALPTPAAHARLRPLPLGAVQLTGGFWHDRQRTNRLVGLPHGGRMLEETGTLQNLRIAAGQASGEFRGYVFQDSDSYKWLEALALELANGPDAALRGLLDPMIRTLAAAQQPDGYLNSHFTVAEPGARWTDLEWAHEMYCAGHLIEAAIAHQRVTGRSDLMAVARRLADHLDATFGPGKRAGVCGHPEIELALVELYRQTGERRYLALAGFFVDQRGHSLVTGVPPLGPAYMQERVPVREAQVVEGHAVRQLYLNAGVTDLYLETGEPALLAAQRRLWTDLAAHKLYLTGGCGSSAQGEAFGLAFDLPDETAYCETCASIALMMWSWRMLLATGEAAFASVFERAWFNGFLSGVSLSGDRFFYENPLRSRAGRERQPWYKCACCPPNVMRTLALAGGFLATADETGAQIHQYASARLQAGPAALTMETDYPWQGRVQLTVESAPRGRWRLDLRIPDWAAGASVKAGGERSAAAPGSYVSLEREWRAGDAVELDLSMDPRLTRPDPRVAAAAGCLAIERGPLVYCLEGHDEPAGSFIDDWRLDPAAPLTDVWAPDMLGGVMTVSAGAATAIPFYAWANRGLAPMRVWIPQAGAVTPGSAP